MAISRLGQVGRLCTVSGLLLAGLLFAGCQTNKPSSGFADVPGVAETVASATPQTPRGDSVAASTNPGATNKESSEII